MHELLFCALVVPYDRNRGYLNILYNLDETFLRCPMISQFVISYFIDYPVLL